MLLHVAEADKQTQASLRQLLASAHLNWVTRLLTKLMLHTVRIQNAQHQPFLTLAC
jgi:hypothetical protein